MVRRQALTEKGHNSSVLGLFAHLLDGEIIVAVVDCLVDHPSQHRELALPHWMRWLHFSNLSVSAQSRTLDLRRTIYHDLVAEQTDFLVVQDVHVSRSRFIGVVFAQ